MKTVADLLSEIEFEVHDIPHDTWTEDQVLGYLNDATREVVVAKADANPVRQVATLTPNKTLQTIPADGIEIMKIVRNMGDDGATPGRPIAIAEMDSLDALIPDWHLERDAEIVNYMYEKRYGRNFYVYPGAHASTPVTVEMFYSAYPEIMTAADNFVLEDAYIQAAKHYTLYLLFLKEIDDPSSGGRAKFHLESFANELGIKLASEKEYQPN